MIQLLKHQHHFQCIIYQFHYLFPNERYFKIIIIFFANIFKFFYFLNLIFHKSLSTKTRYHCHNNNLLNFLNKCSKSKTFLSGCIAIPDFILALFIISIICDALLSASAKANYIRSCINKLFNIWFHRLYHKVNI